MGISGAAVKENARMTVEVEASKGLALMEMLMLYSLIFWKQLRLVILWISTITQNRDRVPH